MFPLSVGAEDRLRYFIAVLPGPITIRQLENAFYVPFLTCMHAEFEVIQLVEYST